ncbi:oxysterol-binding protein-related protein 1C-like [Impatiens glandulifera]|uniref:oxysterol-binding protein-related protein 1C-like n=1 Tax=Impatiens glandulifera TaxID=253017 RepID=UPI001FB0EFB1|nr:oxysterol-binding protein-related protein 1C-like [Impatiens glandulifera]
MPPPMPVPPAPTTSIRSNSVTHRRSSSSFHSVNDNDGCSNNNGNNDHHRPLINRSLTSSLESLSRFPSVRDHCEVKINDIVGNGISGILYKWVNYGRGWRPRWFVLQDGVLSYYKIHGPNKIVINRDTEKGCKIIGEESIRRVRRMKISHSRSSQQRKPCGEIHLKVSSIRKSRSDDKKFSVFTGTKRMHLRGETTDDRETWMVALQAVKDMFPRVSNSELMAQADNVTLSTEKLRQRLLEEGVRDAAIQDSEYIMKKEFSSLHNHLLLLKQKQLLLIDTMRQLESEKVDLENTVVDESQKHFQETSSRFPQENGSEGTASDSDADNDRHDNVDTDDEDNIYFDTKDVLSTSCNGSDYQGSSSDSDYEEDEEDAHHPGNRIHTSSIKRRKKLPDPVEKETGVSLWAMIKDNIGKDLTKVCLPVYFNEPISSLQKCFEDLEYSYLLDRAYEYGKKGNSLMRILNVAAFAVSGYSSTVGRNCKPFNPLLGETYEADYPDKGVRFISEKVSHHPMVVACHCDGRGWKFWGDSNLKSKFWGRSIQLDPVGVLTLKFDDGETFQWSKVTTSIYNLILGKLYCDHYGTMTLEGNRDYSCKLKFKEQSLIDRNPHQVQGVVLDKAGKSAATLIGKWDESMHYVMGESSGKGKGIDASEAQTLWKRSKPSKFPTRYNLTSFAIGVNELTPGLKEKLPPTDSRLRPDQRCLENGEYTMANTEKLRLEQRQRQARKMQETGWKPSWFSKEKGSNTYCYNGGYWEARESGNWEGCPDIFCQVPADSS